MPGNDDPGMIEVYKSKVEYRRARQFMEVPDRIVIHPAKEVELGRIASPTQRAVWLGPDGVLVYGMAIVVDKDLPVDSWRLEGDADGSADRE